MPYLDNFNLAGGILKIRDLEARESIEKIINTIQGNVGSPSKPIFLKNGIFIVCDDTLNVSISGNAESATVANSADTANEASHSTTADTANEASHSTTADTATALASSSGSPTRPVYFNAGKPVQCGNNLDVNISGNAKNSGTRNEISNSELHVYTCTNDKIKTMDGYTKAKGYAITNTYGSLYYANVTINLPEYFSGLLCVNVTSQGTQACYFNVTSFNESQINGFLICPISISVNLSLFLHVVGY